MIIAFGDVDVVLGADLRRKELHRGAILHDTGVVGVGRRRQVPQIAGRRNAGRGRGMVVVGDAAAAAVAGAVGRDRVVGGVVVERRVRRPDGRRGGRRERLLPVRHPVDRERLAARLDHQPVAEDGALGLFALRRERNGTVGKPVKGQVLVRQE